MKIIGIIGGMGPLATLKLYENLIKQTKAKIDQEHLHIVIDSNPKIPDRNNAILYGGTSPVQKIVESGVYLQKRGVELLLIPCNNTHFFYDEIQSKLEAKILHMIQITAEYLLNKSVKKVGLAATIGTYKSKIYDTIFSKYNIEVEKPNKEAIKKIYEIITMIKAGESPRNFSAIFDQLVRDDFNSDVIIKGCTELSLINHPNNGGRYVDPLEILSMEAIKWAMNK